VCALYRLQLTSQGGKNLKIGLISINAHTKSLNFACPLHTYAFQQFLLANGIESTIIDYAPSYYAKDYDPVYPLLWYTKPKRYAAMTAPMPETVTDPDEIKAWKQKNFKNELKLRQCYELFYVWPERFCKFQYFMDSHYAITEQFFSTKSIETEDPGFDCYICVTDVIWQYVEGHGFDRGFFLAADTMKGKAKIGYAVSRGVYQGWSDAQIEQFKEYIEPFDFIGAREDSFAEHISELTGREVPVVFDPVLLQTKEFWHKIAIPPKTKEKYVLLYAVMEAAADSVKKAIAFAKRKMLKLIIVSAYESNRKLPPDTDCEIIYDIGPEEWLGYIEHAEYIITNSFHSCAFSILFEKEFFVGARNGDKVTSVLKTFGLENRRFTKEYDSTRKAAPIDYERVRAILDEKRRESGDYILNAIHDVEKKYHFSNAAPKHPFYIKYVSPSLGGAVEHADVPSFLDKEEADDGKLSYAPADKQNDMGTFRIEPVHFKSRKYRFAGWYCKTYYKDIPKWYCNDGIFHTAIEINSHPELQLHLFKDGESTEAFSSQRMLSGDTFILDAVWKTKWLGKKTLRQEEVLSEDRSMEACREKYIKMTGPKNPFTQK
jgi:hypothetical protein